MMAAVACGGAAAAAACNACNCAASDSLAFSASSASCSHNAALRAPLRLFLGTQPFARLGLRRDPGLLGGRASFIEGLPQARHLFVKCFRCRSRVRRRHEGAGFESLVDEGSVVPDAKLARDLKRRQSLRMIAAVRMCRLIAGDPDLVKEIGHLCRQHTLEFETPEQIGLRFLRDWRTNRLSRPSAAPVIRRTGEA